MFAADTASEPITALVALTVGLVVLAGLLGALTVLYVRATRTAPDRAAADGDEVAR